MTDSDAQKNPLTSFLPLYLRLEQILARYLSVEKSGLKIHGVHSPTALALLMAHSQSAELNKSAHLIVLPDEKSARSFCDEILFFDCLRDIYFLPEMDVSPYAGLSTNHRVIAERLRFLHHAFSAKPGQIFVTSPKALMQKTLPLKIFKELTLNLSVGEELPQNLHSVLLARGYTPVSTVEDVGTFSIRGSVVDIFSAAEKFPYRLELFGDFVESIRFFDPATQRSIDDLSAGASRRPHSSTGKAAVIIPCREAIYWDSDRQKVVQRVKATFANRPVDREESKEILRALSQGQNFYGMEFLAYAFYDYLEEPLEYFNHSVLYWSYEPLDIQKEADHFFAQLSEDYKNSTSQLFRPPLDVLFRRYEDLAKPLDARPIYLSRVLFEEDPESSVSTSVEYKSYGLDEVIASLQTKRAQPSELVAALAEKLRRWRQDGYRIFIFCHSSTLAQRLDLLLKNHNFSVTVIEDSQGHWPDWIEAQDKNSQALHVLTKSFPSSGRFVEERLVFLRDDDIWGRKKPVRTTSQKSAEDRLSALAFGDLKPGDFIVHRLHGVGIYEGLAIMPIEGVDAEFIRLKYKDNDRLFLPVYRVNQLHKYSGPNNEAFVDKLGGPGWGKTKTKIKNQLRDIAENLLKIYVQRESVQREPWAPPNEDYWAFENSFPYDETPDQLQAIQQVITDFGKTRPMDRLICGDVGFGKTEVAMRAAFRAVQEGYQVAVIAPTTILTFQHTESFKKRFAGWPVEIRSLNRFVSATDVKKTLAALVEGKIDILIGTHRLLSKDVQFKNLGLLIVDEEQKFGVTHKERLRQMRAHIDTLTLSATPIPRTLNMSLMGIRDLSLISTPPEDRLPTRTYVCRFDPDTIRKAIRSEISRGGQIFFLHNRVQTIDEVAVRLRELVPEARLVVAHGQMEETQLENAMFKFVHHECDILLCTSIIESGLDIPRANTIFIDNAHTFGVSQLYQLRGRVGRSKERAYCYLIVPAQAADNKEALERVRIIQENTALGSGLRVAHYDLELRGAGDILGASQSGHINAVGYELYLELLEEALREKKGEPAASPELDPEMNLRIPAFIPDSYIPDIRMRLSYYKALSLINGEEDLERIEDELKDQFGPPPEAVMNLMGLMLIRKLCRDLGVKDISSSKNILTLAFTEKTPLSPQEVIRLTTRENKKYALTPDQRLKVRMNEITWPRVFEELMFLLKLC